MVYHDIKMEMSEREIILTEGAVVERLKREYTVALDPYIASAGLIYDKISRDVLEKIYKQYIDIAMKTKLPIMIMTSTRRADAERVLCSQYKNHAVIEDNVAFLGRIRETYKVKETPIYIGGIMGCKGDAYSGKEGLSSEAAYAYHKQTTQKFKETDVDFLFAGIMPAIEEIKGMARAMSESEIPYIISFMIRDNGKLLDGTLIHDAIEIVEQEVSNKPIGYMVNCVHPKVLRKALEVQGNKTELVRKRFVGIQANTSSMSPEELNCCQTLKEESMRELIEEMIKLHEQYQLKIMGGCCGTTDLHISQLANKLKTSC